MKDLKADWTGSQKELHNVVDCVIEELQKRLDLNCSQKEMNRIFVETLTRNFIIGELQDAINYILYEE